MKERRWLICIALILSLSGLKTVSAGVMSMIDLGSGWSAAVPGGITFSNLRTSDTEVTVDIQKNLTQGLNNLGIFDSVIITFFKTDSAPPKLVIDQETVTNNTGIAWTDYHMFLSPLSVGFDNSTGTPSGNPFTQVAFADFNGLNGLPSELNFEAGTVPIGGTFNPGQASGQIVIATTPNTEESFILKEQPSIPEPATLLLLSGGFMFLKRGRKIK